MIKTLDQIGIETGTDKNSKCHNYTPYYSIFFNPIRQKELNLLEIGIYHGDSLRLWEEFFPNAMIFGADIEDCKQHETDRIKTFIMDQSSKESLEENIVKYPRMDIIICDGSHQSKDDILTFETLWPHLNSGGYFIIEDTLCAYFDQWASQNFRTTQRVQQMIHEVNMGGKVDQNWLCSNKKVEREKYKLNQFEREIEFLFVSCGLVIVKKF